MQTRRVRIAIIGAGTAGMAAYRAAVQHTQDLVVIEAGDLGTTCARVGCMPSKLLLAAADAARSARQAGRFGVELGPVTVLGERVMTRLKSERERFVEGVLSEVAQWPDAHLLRGRARFEAPGRLLVDDALRIEAERIVIATGSRPVLPQAWREVLADRLLLSDDVFNWTKLPASTAVVGAGAIGLELALGLQALGVRTSLYAREAQFGTLSDPALNKRAAEIYGVALPLRISEDELEFSRNEDGSVRVSQNGVSENFEYVLAAVGREPALDELDLSAAGIPRDAKGRVAFDAASCQVAELPVFIAGDADDEAPILHVAAEDGRIAGLNAAAFPAVQPHPRQTPMSVVFSAPQIATAGQRHAQLLAAGEDFVTGSVSFATQGRARLAGQAQGALHVYAGKADGRVLGAEMIGPAAEHLAHLLAWAIQAEERVDDLLRRPFYHPVFEEGLRTALVSARKACEGEVPEESGEKLSRVLA